MPKPWWVPSRRQAEGLTLAGVPSLTELVRVHTDLGDEDVAWLHLLLADWQIIADLSFADLVLWLPGPRGPGLLGRRPDAAHHRPDGVRRRRGRHLRAGRPPAPARHGLGHGRLVREGDPEWRDDVPVRVEAIPVRRAGA